MRFVPKKLCGVESGLPSVVLPSTGEAALRAAEVVAAVFATCAAQSIDVTDLPQNFDFVALAVAQS